jgi:hypothetical protein
MVLFAAKANGKVWRRTRKDGGRKGRFALRLTSEGGGSGSGGEIYGGGCSGGGGLVGFFLVPLLFETSFGDGEELERKDVS